MGLTKANTHDIDRWYQLKYIAEQKAFNISKKRFRVVNAGRRSGKTENAKRYLVQQALTVPGTYFIAAPTVPQVKKIYWKDICRLSFLSVQKSRPNKSELIVFLDNGSEIHFLGMEKPKRFEGSDWAGGILDEFAYYKPDAWPESIRPALSTESPERPGYKPWCIILSKPNGRNHFYDICKYAQAANDPEWDYFTWESDVVLSEDEIAAAKRSMSLRQFNQEYRAMFVSDTGRIYDEYSIENHCTSDILPHEQIHYFCDFNYTPMSHGVAVIRDKKIYVLDEFILESAKGYMNVMEFCEKYKQHLNKTAKVFGDRSGRNGENHNFESEYIQMTDMFEKYGWTVDLCVPKANPGIKERQNCLNALVLNAEGERRFFVDPIKAPTMDRGMETVVFKKGSTFQEEQSNNTSQHITTGAGYMANVLFPIEYEHDFDDYRMYNIFGV